MKDFIENGKKAYNMELKILSVLEDACKAIKQNYGIALDLDTIPIDDSKTFELLQQGQTGKVFVFHRKALQRYLRELHPENLDHLAALYALYWVSRFYGNRKLKHYIARKNGREKIECAALCMAKFLKETYGIGIYVDQMMLMSQHIAGFSEAESEELGKVLYKRVSNKWPLFERMFIERGMNNGFDIAELQIIWSQWYNEFAYYGFSKARAASLARIAYLSAYFKANYPDEYLDAISRSNMKKDDYFI
jgi:DNA polymerase-3 subunit alpha